MKEATIVAPADPALMSCGLLFFLPFILFFLLVRQEQYFFLGLLFWATKKCFWACCFGQLNNFFDDDRLGYGFLAFSCSNQLFYDLKTLCDDVSYAGTTFIFSLYLKSFLVLNLHLNNFLLSRA